MYKYKMTDIKGKVVPVLTSATSNEGIWWSGDHTL